MHTKVINVAVSICLLSGSIPADCTVIVAVRQRNTITFATNSNESKPLDDGTFQSVGEHCKVLSNRRVFVLHSGLTSVHKDGEQLGDVPKAIQQALDPSLTLDENEARVTRATENEYRSMTSEANRLLTPEQRKQVAHGRSPLENQLLVFGGFDSKGVAQIRVIYIAAFTIGLRQPYFYVGHLDIEEFNDTDFAIVLDLNGAMPGPWMHAPNDTRGAILDIIKVRAEKDPALYGGKVVMGQITKGHDIEWIENGSVCGQVIK